MSGRVVGVEWARECASGDALSGRVGALSGSGRVEWEWARWWESGRVEWEGGRVEWEGGRVEWEGVGALSVGEWAR